MADDHLQVRGLSVDFDGFVAVDRVDLTVAAGGVHFLIGPNGAGKTTLVDAITGLVRSTGSVRFGGIEINHLRTHRRVRRGVGRTFQTATLFEQLTVVQNLDVAAGIHRPMRSLLRARRGIAEPVDRVLDQIGLRALADRPAGTLAHGQAQWLEIGMLLVQDARLMLIDEPVAGMSGEEREQTGRLLTRISRDHVVVVIEHDMDFVRAFAERVTVMHAGRILAEGTVAQIQADQQVQEAYLGRVAVEAGGGA